MSLENIVTNLELDVYNHDSGQPTIKAIALDDNTRYVAAMVRYNGMPYNVGQDATVELIIIRPDKVGVATTGSAYEIPYDDPSTEGIEVIYGVYAELDQPALALSGILLGQFKITSGTQILRTEIFHVNNGRALDAETKEWCKQYETYNLDEYMEEVKARIAHMEALMPSAKVSGATVHFVDGADNVPMKSLKVAIEPVQSGSGDPSPDNVRPISGYDAVNVVRAGKNIAIPEYSNEEVIHGITITPTSNGIHVSGKCTTRFPVYLTPPNPYNHIPLNAGEKNNILTVYIWRYFASRNT